MSGRGIVEAALFRSELAEIDARQSDPSTPAVGESWIRTDIQPKRYHTAELRVEGSGGTKQIPIHEDDTEDQKGSSTYPIRRVLFDSGNVGILYGTTGSSSDGSPRLLMDNGALIEAHDSPSTSTWPPSSISRATDTNSIELEGNGRKLGVIIDPAVNLSKITVDRSANTGFRVDVGADPKGYARIVDDSDGSLVKGKTIDDATTNFSISAPLSKSKQYRLVWRAKNSNRSVKVGYAEDTGLMGFYGQNFDVPAAYDTNNGRVFDRFYGFNNISVTTGGAIPDGLVYQYEARLQGVSDGADVNLVDQQGNKDLTASGANVSGNNNNFQKPTVQSDSTKFNGAQYYATPMEVAGQFASSLSPPYRIFIVAEYDSINSGPTDDLFDEYGDRFSHRIFEFENEFFYNDSTGASVTTPSDKNRTLFESQFKSSSFQAYQDETSVGSTNNTPTDLNGLIVGDSWGESRRFDGRVAAFLVADESASGYSASNVRQYLYDNYGDGSQIT